MPMARLTGVDIHCELADDTDPWRAPETVLLLHGCGHSVNLKNLT